MYQLTGIHGHGEHAPMGLLPRDLRLWVHPLGVSMDLALLLILQQLL